jgi:hypothetical protein
MSAIYSPLNIEGFDIALFNKKSRNEFNVYLCGINKESVNMMMYTWKGLLNKPSSDSRFKAI